MAAPEGNNFWTKRSKHGRDLIFADPAALLEAAEEYFTWADRTPWYKNEAIRGGEAAGRIIKVPTQRPYTLAALSHFLDIDFDTWTNYKDRPVFKEVITKIEEFIKNQKFEGAVVGVFNANIIARDLGLVDKKDVTTDGEGLNKGFFEFVKKVRTKTPENPTE